jgi:ribosomal protein S18 acetylase RimI-like enzyme
MITVTAVNRDNTALLEALLLAEGGAAAVEGLRAARERYDLLRSDSFWLLAARVDGQPAGLAAVARLPKADARVGFLFVDELWVLPAYRRQGVASALLRHIIALASDLGLAGVRLLVRPENEAARRLYRALGFGESATVLCER